MVDHGDGSSGSTLGGFSHAKSIEPGAADKATEKQDGGQDDELVLPDPEGLAGAHGDAEDD